MYLYWRNIPIQKASPFMKNHPWWPNGAFHVGELRSNDIFSQFYILRGQGQGWGSFDTPLHDVGEVGTPSM